MKKVLLSALLLSSLWSFGQDQLNYFEGQLLVQLDRNTDPVDLEQEFKTLGLHTEKMVSAHMNIYLFNYDKNTATIDQAIAKMYNNTGVKIAQRNHRIEQRAVPNDTEFGSQWQYVQANDRDIDADEAWDVTTGGVTPDGDSIVVCVIDDGANLAHPDLIPNIWTNAHEIPNNGIDDDNNGFVDDVMGWNAYDDNDEIEHTFFWEGHGSAVAGIVGAKGNNGEGVAGVNWDVKLMVVKGGGGEAEALAAYSYPLACRKLYNETNGAQGAFVVATNASWGVDGGQAASAPLWCAMYDTLGVYGILNAGATINGNENVDVFGDLPTQCGSDYLISVTNTNQQDTKVTQAGYGAMSIDLGAPGEGTWTVNDLPNATGYSGFGGTSGATPHVAGTIALLYSVPCSEYSMLAKNDPQQAALKARQFILEGVDANSSLDGITVTGGRLNVNNAVQALVNTCSVINSIEEESNVLFDLNIQPNPIQNDLLQVQFTAEVNGAGTINVTDMYGKLIYSEAIQVVNGQNQSRIQLPALAQGMYNVSIQTADAQSVVKFVK